MKLSIIILNWNTEELLHQALKSVYQEAGGFDFEVIVADNNSSDFSREMVIRDFPQAVLVANKENLGFARGNNEALKVAKGDYLMLLNSDTIIKDGAINKLVKYLDDHQDVVMVGPKLLNADMTFQHACRRSLPDPVNSFFYLSGLASIFPKSKTFNKYKQAHLDENLTGATEAISGAAMMFRKSVYEKIGGLDEEFFMYGEDLDFCKRVGDIGKIAYVSEAVIVHLYGASSKKRKVKSLINFYDAMWMYYKKHLSRDHNPIINFIIFVGIKSKMILSLVVNFVKTK